MNNSPILVDRQCQGDMQLIRQMLVRDFRQYLSIFYPNFSEASNPLGRRMRDGGRDDWGNTVEDLIFHYTSGSSNYLMRRTCKQLFATQKYFKDNKFVNLSLETQDQLGSLHHVSNVFSTHNIDMTFIKSRISNVWTDTKKYGLDVTIDRQTPAELDQLKQSFSEAGVHMEVQPAIKVAWFPRCENDLDLIGKVLLKVNEEVNSDSPQFTDPEYRKRRDYIAQIAMNYRVGQKIPDVPYTREETNLWKNIYAKLRGLHKKCMSQRYENQMKKLEREFLFTERIPQLNELNSYLKNKTGFQIKPTHGILSQREFLNCFAFRVFCCTQYLRHTANPDYTPEPDIVHEIVGHVPMFADPDIAELSQEIGLLSLGASDAQIAQLGALYWFTLEFGACKEGNERMGYGAGIASSIGEIQNFISGKAKFKKFEPMVDCDASYTVQTVQQTYRVTESFDEAIRNLERYGHNVMKPMTTTFNFETNRIDYDRNIEGVETEDKGPKF